jgi:hypothetical protein
MRIETAKAALDRIRLATNAGNCAQPEDIEILVAFLAESERAVLGAGDILRQSRNVLRNRQVERARQRDVWVGSEPGD